MAEMTRVDLCAADDYETRELLVTVIAELGGWVEDLVHESALGVGLHRFQLPAGEVTVFVDAWAVDLAGPNDLVQQILAAMSER